MTLALWLAIGCKDSDGDGVRDGRDCAPLDPAVSPDAAEICNGRDDDCDGQIDEDVAIVAYFDGDGDGWGDSALARRVCTLPSDGATVDGDCDDADPTVSPGATELCDGLDNDCNDVIDDGALLTFYLDEDGDGHGTDAMVTTGCTPPEGYAPADDDCDDADPLAWTDAPESCDSHDNDCDGLVDEDLPLVRVWIDADGDGAGDPDAPAVACGPLPGLSDDPRDCDDTDPAVGPDAVDVQGDGVDTDCDGWIDEFGIPVPFATVEDALAAAPPGAVVQFDEGVFDVSLDLTGHDVVLAGEGCAWTTLRGLPETSVVIMDGGTLSSITLTGGSGTPKEGFDGETEGGGLLVRGDATAEHVCLSDNSASKFGGGISVTSGTLVLRDAVVDRNESGGNGGGLYVGPGTTVDATRVVFRDNAALSGDGGGARVDGGTLLLRNAAMVSNQAVNGGALKVNDGNGLEGVLTLRFGTLHGNRTHDEADLGQAIYVYDGTATVTDTSFTGHDQAGAVVGSFLPTALVLDRVAFALNAGRDLDDVWLQTALRAHDPRFVDLRGSIVKTWDLRWLPGAPWADAGDPALSDPDGSPAGIGAYSGPDTWADALDSQIGDEDGDGIPTGLEIHLGLNPIVDDAAQDPDGDGLDNAAEAAFGGDPFSEDGDGDGWSDLLEVGAGTDPARAADHHPAADTGGDRIAAVGEPVPLDAGVSWDPDGADLTFRWVLTPAAGSALTDVDDPDSPVTSFVPDVVGVFTVTLVVADDAVEATDSLVVTALNATIVPDDVATLAEAALLAPPGTAVALRPGVHLGVADLGSRSLALIGLGDQAEDVVLDGLGAGPLVRTEGAPSLAIGHLTLRHGQATNGGCVAAYDTLALTLLDVAFEDCAAVAHGGAVFATGAAEVARDIPSRRGFADRGGALFTEFGTLDVAGWVSDTDEADDRGGAFALGEVAAGTDRVLSQLVVQGARARHAAALDQHSGTFNTDLVVRNAVFLGNEGDSVLFSGGAPVSLLGVAFLDNEVDAVLDGETPYFVSGVQEGGNSGPVASVLVPVDPAPWVMSGRPAFASAIHDHDIANDRLVAVTALPDRLDTVDAGFPDESDPDGTAADVGPGGGPGARAGAGRRGDADGDGLDDGWELHFGLDPTNPADEASDDDGDGLDATAEYALGTDPNAADSDRDGVDDLDEAASGDAPADERDHRPAAHIDGPWVGAIAVPQDLDGSASADPDGAGLSYAWSLDLLPALSGLTTGALASAASVAVQPDVAGLFRANLVVSDAGASSAVRYGWVRVPYPVTVPGDYDDLQAAVEASIPGQVIAVAPGDWPVAIAQGSDNLTIVGAGIGVTRLVGTAGAPIANLGVGDALTLRDLTLTFGDGIDGGAVQCYEAGLTLDRVRAERNISRDGGALRLDGCDTLLTDVELVDNDGWKAGGAAWVRHGTLTWIGGRAERNIARGAGGALELLGDLDADIRNVAFVDNESEDKGGAVHLNTASVYLDGESTVHAPVLSVDHVTMVRNRGDVGALHAPFGVLEVVESAFVDNEGYGLYVATANAEVSGARNAFWGNVSGPATPLSMGLDAPDALLVDPLFVDLDAGDVRLLPASPLRDAGAGMDPDGTASDVGAYGGPDAPDDFDSFYGDEDGDGLPDGWELWFGLDPTVPDPATDDDGDGLDTMEEAACLCDPFDPDSDVDGRSDGAEVAAGDDPTDPADHAPDVAAGVDASVSPGVPVSPVGSASDPDGEGLTWSWTLAEAPGRSTRDDTDIAGAATSSPTFIPDTPGRFVLRATVSAGGGFTVDDVVVTALGDVLVPEDYAEVADAVMAVAPGDAVRIGAGTYPLSMNADGAGVTLVGAGRDLTVLDGGDRAVLRAVGGEQVWIEGLTVTGSFASGGAVEVVGPSTFTTSAVRFEGNHGVVAGGLSVENADWIGDDVQIVDNLASRLGAGAYVLGDAVADLVHLLVAGNEAIAYRGGGFYIWNASVFATNAIFHGNVATFGAAVFVLEDDFKSASLELDFTTATWNNATDSLGSFAYTEKGALTIRRSIIAFQQGDDAITNTSGETVLTDMLVWDSGTPFVGEFEWTPEIVADPLLTDVDEIDWTDDDWTLLPGSPARGAAEFEGDVVDLGAYGGPAGSWWQSP